MCDSTVGYWVGAAGLIVMYAADVLNLAAFVGTTMIWSALMFTLDPE